MTALVTENIALLAGAPQGISRLRALILELAIRGKLVQQAPEDEHPSEFFSRIDLGKAAKFTKGELARFDSLASSPVASEPFAVPPSWEWRRLGALGLIGSSSRVHQKDWTSAGVPFYRTREIVQLSKTGSVEPDLFISEELYDDLTQRGPGPAQGDIMLTGVGTIGVPYVVRQGDRFYFKDASVLIFKNHFGLSPDYLSLVFSSPYWKETIHKESMGTTVHTLTISRANEVLIPVAPAGEQDRIVAKVDELMALCDRLEAEQADAEAAHAKLVEALLASLTQARDAADFRASWQQLAEHFHTLFTTEASVDALKQTVMQLGVSGRLTACDQSVADAPECSVTKPLWDTAHGWIWRTLGEVLESGIQNGISPKAVSAETPVRCLTLSATTRGKFNASCFKYVDLDEEVAGKYRLQPGDLLVQRANSIDYVGVSAVYDGDGGAFIFPDLMMRMRAGKLVTVEFLHLCLAVEPSRAYMRANATGTQGNMPKVNQGTVSGIPVPVPPLESQHRIVSKVNEILTLCDQLKACIATDRAKHMELAEALVTQAAA